MARNDFRFSHSLRVRYSEIDGQNIVFNAHYLTYFDIAITEFLRALPYDYHGMVERLGQDFRVVRAAVDYRKPILLDEEIDVCCRVARAGRSSLTFGLEIHPKGAEDLRAQGELVWVNADMETEQSAALPTDLLERLDAAGELRRD